MSWIKVSMQAAGIDPEVVLAWAAELDFDAFEQEGSTLNAYVPADRFDEAVFGRLASEFPFGENLRWTASLLEDKNWNETWEKQYEPVRIDQRVTIRAPFHPAAPEGDIALEIEPKMSFGTGHHPTTTLMIRMMLRESFIGKTVLDLGCGSGVLGILAARLGAVEVTGIDIDVWAVENTRENCERNGITCMRVEQGDARAIGERQFDFVLANINRNILVKEMPVMANAMHPKALLMMSGFLNQDLPVIREAAAASGLHFIYTETDNEWAAITFQKP